jgi:D-glycero-alpha-D-manno-heptose-7-phosphate kinase
MILGKAPFRISFAGGGSDLKAFASRHYGAVVSTSINKFMYIMLHPYFHEKIRIKYSKLEDVARIEDIRHPIVRECLKRLKVAKGIEIASIADVPARSGLGSSSAFTVCLLQILYAHKGKSVSKGWLAEEAAKIEIDILKEPIGKQDQYASSFGGLNFIRFNEDGTVDVEPLMLRPQTIETLEQHLLLFYIGRERRAARILRCLTDRISNEETFERLKKMVGYAEDLRAALKKGQIGTLGEILREGWLLKKSLAASITNPEIDDYYERALEAGAVGGKLLGAGAGGFFLFFCAPKRQNALRRALGLRELRLRFENDGSRIIYADA